MYKKIAALVAGVIIFSSLTGITYGAAEIVVTPVVKAAPLKKDARPVSMKEFFTQYCNNVGYGLPEVFRQIPLRIPGVKREDLLYSALQRCAYLGFIPNSNVTYKRTAPVTSRCGIL